MKFTLYFKLKFTSITLIALVFFTFEPIVIEAQTREILTHKVSSKLEVPLKKNHLYKKHRAVRKIKKTKKKMSQVFHPYAKNLKHSDKWNSKKTRGSWSVILGGLGAIKPKYKGSDQYDFRGLPFIDIKYKKIFFLNFREGIGMNVLYAPNFRAGIALNFYGSRDADDSEKLQGLQDIDAGLDAGAFSSISFGKFSAKLKLRQDISNNHNGLLISTRLAYRISLIKRLLTNINIRATFANDDYMESYFGVTSAQSSSSGIKEFKASSGIKNLSGGASFIYPFDKNWSIMSFADYSRLLNDAANSPLVKDMGSKNQFLVGLGVGYRF